MKNDEVAAAHTLEIKYFYLSLNNVILLGNCKDIDTIDRMNPIEMN